MRQPALALHADPPAGWDARVGSTWLGTGFAAASRAVGCRAYFAEDERDRAVVLVRSVPVPFVDGWTRRAKVYVDARDGEFLRDLAESLTRLGVSHVRVGDQMHAWAGAWPGPWPALRPETLYVCRLDRVTGTDEELRRALREPARKNIRKAERAGVTVTEATSEREVEELFHLLEATGERIHEHGSKAVYPLPFFRAAWRHMVPRGEATFLLARAGDALLAGQLYFLSAESVAYYHGGSTRERELTPKQGPSAIFWHALRLARDRAVPFDMGGITPNDDTGDPQAGVTEFKRQWVPHRTAVEIADIVLSPAKVRFQERVLLPLWERAHPLYLRAFGRAS
ncbi:MAG TPA: GNAT family N-acetyltransferase [Methylomirabilota bacterium]